MNDLQNASKNISSLCREDEMAESVEFKEFTRNICNDVERELGEDYRVEVREIMKNNGIVLQGLMITPETGSVQNVVPTIYLNDLFKAYKAGMDFTAVIKKLLTAYRENTPKECIDMEFFRSFEKVRSRICFRLIGRAKNEELLADVPHKDFLDLAVCFYYAYHGEPLGEGAILIHNSHMEMWGITVDDLWAAASINTPELKHGRIENMEDILKEALAGRDNSYGECCCMEKSPVPMLVITNTERVYGAAVVLYSGMLEQVADKSGSDLFILPSSLHEVIAIPVSEKREAAELKEMVMEVNRKVLRPEDVLTDNVYIYRREQDKLEIA